MYCKYSHNVMIQFQCHVACMGYMYVCMCMSCDSSRGGSVYLPRERSPEPSACTVGWSRTRLFTRKLATVKPLLVPAATLEEGREEGGKEGGGGRGKEGGRS